MSYQSPRTPAQVKGINIPMPGRRAKFVGHAWTPWLGMTLVSSWHYQSRCCSCCSAALRCMQISSTPIAHLRCHMRGCPHHTPKLLLSVSQPQGVCTFCLRTMLPSMSRCTQHSSCYLYISTQCQHHCRPLPSMNSIKEHVLHIARTQHTGGGGHHHSAELMSVPKAAQTHQGMLLACG
jgi:hypothetical protein